MAFTFQFLLETVAAQRWSFAAYPPPLPHPEVPLPLPFVADPSPLPPAPDLSLPNLAVGLQPQHLEALGLPQGLMLTVGHHKLPLDPCRISDE